MGQDSLPTGILLEARLSNAQAEQLSLKRKYQELSSSGGSSSAFDGPIVKIEETRAGFGFPAGLPHLPLRKNIIQADEPRVPLWTECQREAVSILYEAELDFEDVRTIMVSEANKPDFTPTLQIQVVDTVMKDLWRPTLITIGQMLHHKAAPELRALISIFGSEKRSKNTFAIPPDHEIIGVWSSSLRDPVLRVLDNCDFLELGVWFWGVSESSAKLTVLIVVKDKLIDEAKQMRKEILEICAPSGLIVDIVEGKLLDSLGFNDRLDAGARAGKQSYVEKVPMGHSIGVEEIGGGTLGGYLVLVDPSNDKNETPIFLTNWQVVRPSDFKPPYGKSLHYVLSLCCTNVVDN